MVYRVPDGWNVYSVDQIKANTQHSCVAGPFGSKVSAKYFVDDGVPLIRGSNLRDDLTRFVPKGFVYLSEEYSRSFLAQHVTANDLVFTCWGTVGQVGIIPKEGPFEQYIISNKQLKLRVNESLANPLFCFYYFASPRYVEHVRGRGIGGAVPGINLGILKSLRLALPKRTVQDRIVEVLSGYDELIENNKQRIALLDRSARLLFREWFVHLRFPGHEHVKKVDGLPIEWERRPVAAMSSFLGRGISPVYDDDGESRVVNQKCVRNGLLSLDLSRRQRREYSPEKTLQYMDVLINSTGTGTLGRVAQCWFHPSSTTFDTHVSVVRPNDSVDKYWFGFALLELESVFEGMGEGATNQKELSRGRIAETRVVTPPRPLQTAFGSFATDVSRQIQLLKDHSSKLAQARDLLLPRLISGELAA